MLLQMWWSYHCWDTILTSENEDYGTNQDFDDNDVEEETEIEIEMQE